MLGHLREEMRQVAALPKSSRTTTILRELEEIRGRYTNEIGQAFDRGGGGAFLRIVRQTYAGETHSKYLALCATSDSPVRLAIVVEVKDESWSAVRSEFERVRQACEAMTER
ncbi:MAG TPA: hypothetical protein VMF06_14265, partial [Candidatus Limnocylindria bacterium]|nr:hypothetical protein [Candidatus Limnocylindria bacterium]